MTIDDSEGYLDFELAGADKPHRVDVYVANDTFLEAYKGLQDDASASALFNCSIDACRELGFGEVSARTAQKIEQAVFARMDELRKKDSPAATTP